MPTNSRPFPHHRWSVVAGFAGVSAVVRSDCAIYCERDVFALLAEAASSSSTSTVCSAVVGGEGRETAVVQMVAGWQ